MRADLLTIGEAADMAGVSVQTLRHYDKLGLIVPTQVTVAGYRLYSETDCARLELLRTLRGLGFDLETIGKLLQGEMSPARAVELQIDALEVQQRTLKRQSVVLKAVLAGEQEVILSRLKRMQALAGLDKWERESFLATHLKKGMGGQTGDPEVWKAAVLDLPDELNEAQLEAWLELAEIATSPRFQQTLKNQMQPLAGLSAAGAQEWGQQTQQVMIQSGELIRKGVAPGSAQAQAVVEGWIEGFAKIRKRKASKAFAGWLLEHFESIYDPIMNRYWERVAFLKGWKNSPAQNQAFEWVLQGLRQKVKSIR